MLPIIELSSESSLTFKFLFAYYDKTEAYAFSYKVIFNYKEKIAHIYNFYKINNLICVSKSRKCKTITQSTSTWVGVVGDSLPLASAMNTLIFQTEIVKYSFKIIK